MPNDPPYRHHRRLSLGDNAERPPPFPPPRTKLKPAMMPLLLLMLACGGGTLATLTTYVGVVYGLSDNLRDKLYAGKASHGERTALAVSRTRLLGVWDAWLPYDDLAQIVLANAVQVGTDTPIGRALMLEVLRLETEALRRNPANAFAWSRLAYARLINEGPSLRVAEPLVISMQAAPYEPDLLVSRIVTALAIEPHWTEELRDRFPQQLARAWQHSRVETVRAAYQDGVTTSLRSKLSTIPEAQAQFDALIGDLSPHPVPPRTPPLP